MKIINKYILVAAASLSVVACSQDDGLSNSYLKDSDAVHITAQVGSNEATGGFISRSNPLGSEVEQAKFNEGDAISVVADNQDAVIYSYDGTSWSPKEKGLHLVWNSNEMNFKAFYPANANGASANSTSKCKITKCFCKSTPLVLRNSISFLASH